MDMAFNSFSGSASVDEWSVARSSVGPTRRRLSVRQNDDVVFDDFANEGAATANAVKFRDGVVEGEAVFIHGTGAGVEACASFVRILHERVHGFFARLSGMDGLGEALDQQARRLRRKVDLDVEIHRACNRRLKEGRAQRSSAIEIEIEEHNNDLVGGHGGFPE